MKALIVKDDGLIYAAEVPEEPSAERHGINQRNYFDKPKSKHYRKAYKKFEAAIASAKESAVLCADQEKAKALIWRVCFKSVAEAAPKDYLPMGIYPIEGLWWEVKWMVDNGVDVKETECRSSGVGSKGYTYQVAILSIKKETMSDPQCCGVPVDLHGTCCGWENAIAPCSAEFIISDKRHPGFGQHLNRWKNTYMNGSEDGYDITEKSSFASGWDAAINALRESTPSTEQESQEELWKEVDDIVEDKIGKYYADLPTGQLTFNIVEALKEQFNITRKP